MYYISKNILAPKLTQNDGINIENKSHMIMWDKCNFRCSFCLQASSNFNNKETYHSLGNYEYIAVIAKLMQTGKNFKFSGGEPTLNPRIEWDLQVVKDLGGTVFFDTNGSKPEIVKRLLDKGLIDVLAVSFKGLTPEKALETANIKKREFCWDNVFKTIEYGSKTVGVKVIVTHVCYNDVSFEEILRYSSLFEPYENVFYKINNLHKSSQLPTELNLTRVDPDNLLKLLNQLVKQKPRWQDHIIYVDDDYGISNYDGIVFL